MSPLSNQRPPFIDDKKSAFVRYGKTFISRMSLLTVSSALIMPTPRFQYVVALQLKKMPIPSVIRPSQIFPSCQAMLSC